MKTFLLSLFLLLSFLSGQSQTGSIDHAFGTNGKVKTTMGITSVTRSMAIQTDGKIVVAGSSSDGINSEFALVRYNGNGTLDNTFNGNGKITTSFGSQAEAFSVAVQNDGKIVAAGYMYTDSTWEFAVTRYNANGTPDSTFDNDGKLTTAIGSIDDEINAIAIQTDGKIVVTGYTNGSGDINSYEPDLAIVRYNNNGSLDSTFSNDGIATSDLGSFDIANSIAIQANGKILIGGTHVEGNSYQFLLARYNTDGSFDSTLDKDDSFTSLGTSSYNVIHSIAIQPDGKIVASGISGNDSTYDFGLIRYNSNGNLDSTFNGTGKLITPIGTYFDIPTSVGIESNGKILVGASFSDNDTDRDDLILVRYNSNGSLDNSFGTNGKIIAVMDNDVILAMKLTEARIYLAGSDEQFLIAAYQNNVSVLPVNLLSFTGAMQNNVTKLQWKTAGENTSLFKIERSNDGKIFTKIGEQYSLTGNSEEKNYLYNDLQPLQGTSFYRLKMIDADGNFTYSNIISVKKGNENNISNISVSIYPNPTTDIIHVKIPSSQKETITVQVTDVFGKTIKRETITSTGESVSTSIDVAALQNGSYFLSVNTTGRTQVQKFIKQ